MVGEGLDRILNGLSKDEYAEAMGLNYTLWFEPTDPLDEYRVNRTERLNTLYGHPSDWPAAKLHELADAAAGVEALSEGDGLTEIKEESKRMSDDWEWPVWAVPYLTASSRGELEAIVAHDEAMPGSRFARRMMERINPAPKLRVMPGYIDYETKYGEYDPFFDIQEEWDEYHAHLLDGEDRLDVSLEPERARKLLEAIDDLEARGIEFDRITPIATGALLKLSELANRGLFEHFTDLEPYVPYVDPRSEDGWVYLCDEEGQYRDPEDGEYIDTSSTLYYLPESQRFFVDERGSYFFGGKTHKDNLWQMTREGAYDRIKTYATSSGEKFSTAAAPAYIDACNRYKISSSDKALKVIAELTAEFEPESAVKKASDGVHDLWHLENIDEYILAEKADAFEGARDIMRVTEREAEEFKRKVAAALMPDTGSEYEFSGVLEDIPTTRFYYDADGDIYDVHWDFNLDDLASSHLLDDQKYVVELRGDAIENDPLLYPILSPYDESSYIPDCAADPIKILTFQELCEELRDMPGIVEDGVTSFHKLEDFAQRVASEALARDENGDLIPDRSRWVALDEWSSAFRFHDFDEGDLNKEVNRLYRMPDSDRYFVESVFTAIRDGAGVNRHTFIDMHELSPEQAYRRIRTSAHPARWTAIIESESYALSKDPRAVREISRLTYQQGRETALSTTGDAPAGLVDELESSGIDLAATQSLDEIALDKSIEAGCVTPDKCPAAHAATALNGQDGR